MPAFVDLVEWANSNEGLLQALAMLGGLLVLALSLMRQRRAEAASRVRARISVAGLSGEERTQPTSILTGFGGEVSLDDGILTCAFDRMEDAVEAALVLAEGSAGTGSIYVGELDLEPAPEERIHPGRVVVSAAVRRALLDENWVRVRAAPGGASFPFLVESRPDRRRRPVHPLRRSLGALVGAGLLLAGGGYWWQSRSDDGKGVSVESLAVLPLANLSGDSTQEFFADGMTETLIGELGRIEDIRVISRTSVMAFKNHKATLSQVAQALGVDAILEGAVARDGKQVRISARLLSGRDDRVLWSGSYERDSSSFLSLQREVAEAIAASIRAELLGEIRPARPIDPMAQEAFFRALQHIDRRTRDDFGHAIRRLQEAIALEPNWSLAHAKLAEAHWFSVVYGFADVDEILGQVRETAARAFELDPESPDAGAWYGMSLSSCPAYDWSRAREVIDHVVDRHPYHLGARRVRRTVGLALGDLEAFRADDERVRELDPLSFVTAFQGAMGQHMLRRFDQAAEDFARLLERFPGHRNLRRWHARSLFEAGRLDDAEASLATLQPRSATDDALRAYGLALRGDADASVALALEVERAHPGDWRARWHVARVYATAGEPGHALRTLEEWGEQCRGIPFFFGDPGFDSLRDAPRFQAVVRGIGIDPARFSRF